MTIRLAEVKVERATGLTVLCGKPETVATWEEVDEVLNRLASGVEFGRSDSIDFVATFEDGFTYSGTIDIRNPLDRNGAPSILAHVQGAHSTLLGSGEEGEGFRRFVDPDGSKAEEVRRVFETYDFASAEPAPRP